MNTQSFNIIIAVLGFMFGTSLTLFLGGIFLLIRGVPVGKTARYQLKRAGAMAAITMALLFLAMDQYPMPAEGFLRAFVACLSGLALVTFCVTILIAWASLWHRRASGRRWSQRR